MLEIWKIEYSLRIPGREKKALILKPQVWFLAGLAAGFLCNLGYIALLLFSLPHCGCVYNTVKVVY